MLSAAVTYQPMPLLDKQPLRKRAVLENVFDALKNICQLVFQVCG